MPGPFFMRSSILAASAIMGVFTLFLAATTLIAKALGNGSLGALIHPVMVSEARFVFGFLAVLAVLGLRRATGRRAWAEPPGGAPRPAWATHALRTALGWTAGALMFAAAVELPLADVNALSFLSPVATMLFAIPLLGERVGPWRWLAAVLALVGAAILLRPGAGVIQPAALLALGAAAALGLEAIIIKMLAVREPPGRTMVINNAMGAGLSILIALPVWTTPSGPAVWAGMAALGAIMVSAQILLLSANRLADASFVAPFFYLSLSSGRGFTTSCSSISGPMGSA